MILIAQLPLYFWTSSYGLWGISTEFYCIASPSPQYVPYSERPAYFSCCWLGNRNSFCHWYNYSVKVMLRNRNAASVPVFPSCLGNCMWVCEGPLQQGDYRKAQGSWSWVGEQRDLPLAEFQVRADSAAVNGVWLAVVSISDVFSVTDWSVRQ